MHRTQKPVDLLEYLVKSYSNEGDTIIDFTCGSGTTGIACLNTNRKCILVEKDETNYKIMEERIKLYIEHKYDFMIKYKPLKMPSIYKPSFNSGVFGSYKKIKKLKK